MLDIFLLLTVFFIAICLLSISRPASLTFLVLIAALILLNKSFFGLLEFWGFEIVVGLFAWEIFLNKHENYLDWFFILLGITALLLL